MSTIISMTSGRACPRPGAGPGTRPPRPGRWPGRAGAPAGPGSGRGRPRAGSSRPAPAGPGSARRRDAPAILEEVGEEPPGVELDRRERPTPPRSAGNSRRAGPASSRSGGRSRQERQVLVELGGPLRDRLGDRPDRQADDVQGGPEVVDDQGEEPGVDRREPGCAAGLAGRADRAARRPGPASRRRGRRATTQPSKPPDPSGQGPGVVARLDHREGRDARGPGARRRGRGRPGRRPRPPRRGPGLARRRAATAAVAVADGTATGRQARSAVQGRGDRRRPSRIRVEDHHSVGCGHVRGFPWTTLRPARAIVGRRRGRIAPASGGCSGEVDRVGRPSDGSDPRDHQGLSFQPSTKPIPKAQRANETGSSRAYCLTRPRPRWRTIPASRAVGMGGLRHVVGKPIRPCRPWPDSRSRPMPRAAGATTPAGSRSSQRVQSPQLSCPISGRLGSTRGWPIG